MNFGKKERMTDVELELDDGRMTKEEAIVVKKDWVVCFEDQRVVKYIPTRRILAIHNPEPDQGGGLLE